WYAVGPASVQRSAGAEVIVNINGSPYYRNKRETRYKMLATRAADNGLFVCYVNTVGGQDELVFDGDSMVFDCTGSLLAEGKQFQEDLIVVEMDVDQVLSARLHDPRWRKIPNGVQQSWARHEVITVSTAPATRRRPFPPREPFVPLDPVAEVYQALVMGTGDYLRKSGFRKVIVGLSGGIDSALTAAIASDALGPENVVGVTMPSQYSSTGSVDDSASLARNLGIQLFTIPIKPAYQTYMGALSEVFAGTEPNVAEENIQARIRGNLLMAISNKFGWILLTTGNKSEYATGYTTLYGDMAGGYAVIKDVPKTLIYELAQHRNRVAGHDLIPQAILDKPPSAELRPGQLDTDSLPPYPDLDPILKLYVEEDRSPTELVEMGFDEAIVRRVVTLVDRSEYKRRQAPPGVKITPRAFGKDRRLPIVNKFSPF
ncbi:MAG: NAD+ synthase, partial [Chloroflexi bacterium]|nr:NAD+ synthase [Chloroflexota bacterium]